MAQSHKQIVRIPVTVKLDGGAYARLTKDATDAGLTVKALINDIIALGYESSGWHTADRVLRDLAAETRHQAKPATDR